MSEGNGLYIHYHEAYNDRDITKPLAILLHKAEKDEKDKY